MRHIRASRDKKSAVRNGLGFYTDSEGGGGFLSPGGGADKLSKYTTPGLPKPSTVYTASGQLASGDVRGAVGTAKAGFGGRAISEKQAAKKEAKSKSQIRIGRQTRGMVDPIAKIKDQQFRTRIRDLSGEWRQSGGGGGGQELAAASKTKIPLWAWAVGGIAGILLFKKSFKIGKRLGAKLKK